MTFVDQRPPRRFPLKRRLVEWGSQRELAAAIGRHEITVNQIANGRVLPTKIECYLIAWELGRHPSELFPDLGEHYDWGDYKEWVEGCLLEHRRNNSRG